MLTAIREALVGAVNADYVTAYPTIPIVYDNAAFDRNNPPETFVEYEIQFTGGDQIGMSLLPRSRLHGFVYVTVFCKEATGSKKALLMLDWFIDKLAYRSVGGVNLQAAEPGPKGSPKGWFLAPLKFYFYSEPV